MRSVLILDDDVRLCMMLREYLGQHRISLEMHHHSRQGLEAALAGQYDLMLLDVTLPVLDGFEVLQLLRKSSNLCVLLLTARGEAADRIRGLQLGADDYLPKPFDPEELVARIRAIIRRSSLGSSSSSSSNADCEMPTTGLRIDTASRSARYRDNELDVTDIEFALLDAFLQSPGVVLTREELVVRIFQRSFHPLDRSLDMHVSRLRRKLRAVTPLGNPIKTIRSSGYLFSTIDL